MALFSRTDQSVLGRWWWTVDRPILMTLLALMGIGVVLVTTASPPVAQRIGLPEFYFIKRHVILLVPALFLLLGTSLCPPRWIWRLGSLLFLGSLFTMLAVLAIGDEVKGARRWIYIFGFSLQPSEFLKISFAVVSAWFISKAKDRSNEKNVKIPLDYKIVAGLFLLSVTLLLMQPDFGMTAILTLLFGAQIFMAGFPLWGVIILGLLAIGGAVGAYFTLSHVRSRVDRFFDPASGDTFQIDKSMDAFKNGGFFGTGPGQGDVKLLLPDAHTDFIFSVAGEEFGFLFALFLVMLFLFIILRGMTKVMNSDDLFAVLAVGGLLSMYGFQIFIHMGSALHILPAKGMTLPFISYGGSSLFATGIGMGIILSLTRKRPRMSVAKGSNRS